MAQRGVGHEADAQLTQHRQHRQHLGLRVPGPQGVLRLQGGDRVDGVGTADGLHARLDSPMWRTLPSATNSASVPTVSSMGVSGSTRCW